MKRLLPQSLLGQMLIILLTGLVVSNAVGWWIYSFDREAAVREVGGLATAQRLSNLARLLEDSPPDLRDRIVAASTDSSFRVSLSQESPDVSEQVDPGPIARAIQAYLIERQARSSMAKPIVMTADMTRQPLGCGRGCSGRGMGWGRYMKMMERGGSGEIGGGRMGAMMEMMRASAPLVSLEAAIPLSTGQWILARTELPEASPFLSRHFVFSMLAMALVVIGASIWAARRVTAPLATLAVAAQNLGRDVNAPPIAETGTRETRQASHAFNEMQKQLRETLENRTRLLAAVSHDLRTPLTLLRLRAEAIVDAEEREKILATLADMERMVGITLQYARDEMSTEAIRTADLTALVASVVDDLADTGHEVVMAPAPPILLECRPSALKRAITNLIDNAVKYGSRARVEIQDNTSSVDITIDDEGPGLAPEEIERVFQPFYRVEGSRARETGGVGLGLAIARSLVERHGGTIALRNRPEGGLRAKICLTKKR